MTKDDQPQNNRNDEQKSDEQDVLGLPWPEAYVELLPHIRERWGIQGTLYLNRKLSGGRSGALVYAADLESQDFTGQAILKLDRTPDPSWHEQHEADLHHQAIADAPDFADKHLPRLLHTLQHNQQIAVLSAIAGRGLQYAKPWIDCTFENQLQVARQVSRGILEDWNQNYRRQSGMRHPKELLLSWLGHRLEPEKGGQLLEFLSNRCGVTPDIPSVTFEGQWYPNPLAFILGNRELPDHLRQRMISGRVHGDLHGQNVLVGRPQSSESDYYLIDLALYKSEQYLFYDHAYFEVAFLLNSRSDISAADWESILRQKHDQSSLSDGKLGSRTDDIGLIELVRSLRQEVSHWIDQHEADRLSYMENQYLLARVAVGLNFTNKGMPEGMRRRAFIYAASNLKDYMQLNGVDWPKYGPPFLLDETVNVEGTNIKPEPKVAPEPVVQPVETEIGADFSSGQQEQQKQKERGRVPTLFNELQRRHVVKVAGLYLIVAWLCVQIATVVKEPLLLPVWTDSLVTILLILGFPIACVIAWAFEVSPGGIQRTLPAEPGSRPVSRNRTMIDFIVVVGIVALLAFTIWRSDFNLFDSEPSAGPGGELPSIAVLPFRNLSADGSNDNFSDGLTIEIMATLARTGEFRITGQTSTFRYKNPEEDLRKIGQDLGVQYLLEGSVRRVGNDIRVESQLTKADNGFLVWSDVFSDQIEDIFNIQEKIANSIGDALKIPLGIQATGLQSNRTSNPLAYELFLSALALANQRGNGLNVQIARGIELLSKSVQIDPNFGAGWAALSLAYDFGVVFPHEVNGRNIKPAVYIRRAAAAAVKARDLSPNLAIVSHAMGNVHRRARQWSSAEDSYRKALEKEPRNVLVLLDYARMLAIVGHNDKAIAMSDKIGEIDPHHPLLEYTRSLYELQDRPTKEKFERLLKGFGKELSFAPFIIRNSMGYLFDTDQVERMKTLISSCTRCESNWREQAIAMIDAVGVKAPQEIYNQYKDTQFLGYPFLHSIGGPELVLKAFENNADDSAFIYQAFLIPWIEVGNVGKTDEFQLRIQDIGLDDYWRERGWPARCKPLEGQQFECQ